ncbi:MULTISPECIES: VPLPA-CTERM sorting domain-containing protein [unclassified Meridianimarinicoccus]|uniref:VPLPA-CTERM sorting domain-containing protein n=1 Tax=unclassified Meridianimarinicoccus TaxID=2923344 RepID=UPI0018665E17|nr:VPLPA-CTERM sorting domain-containing protein [Fluviibacterium sp. MJW13]
MTHLVRTCLVASILVVFTATAGVASRAHWGTATVVQVAHGIVNPLVIYGFNPQPEPPILFPASTTLTPFSVDKTIRGVSGAQFFQVLLGGSLGGKPLDPVAGSPGARFPQADFLVDTGTETLTLRLMLQSSSGGIGANPLFFNPQPEPPPGAGLFGTLGMDFQFTSLSDATVSLQVLDSTGRALGLTRVAAPVPLPAPLALLGAGIGALMVLRRRRR